MSTSKTKAYKLHKWEGEDNVSRVEFNENFEKVDKKLKDIDDRSTDTFNKSENLKNEIQNQNNKYNELRKKIESTVGDVNTSVTVEISNLKNKLSSNTDKLNTIENKVNANNKNYQNGINLNKSQISNLSKNISKNKSDNANNKGRIDILDSNYKNFNGKFIGYDSSINKINKDLSNNTRCLNNLNSKVVSHDNSIKSLNEKINNTGAANDGKSFSYARFYKEERISFKSGMGEFDIVRHISNNEESYKNLGWIILESEDGLVSLRIDILNTFEDFIFATGPFSKNNRSYSGSWYMDQVHKPFAGLGRDGIVRGAIYDGSLKGLFGNGNYAKNLFVYQAFFTKNDYGDDVIRFRYENKGSAFTSNKICITGITFKS